MATTTRYYDDEDEIDKTRLVKNLNDHLLADRFENTGINELLPAQIFNGYKAKEWKTVGFPANYMFLLSKEKLDEDTLKKETEFWNLIINRPKTTKEIIEKETALICLYWAQSQLKQQIEHFKNSTLNYMGHEILGENDDTAKFTFELRLQSKEKHRISKKSSLMFKAVLSDEMLDLPLFRVQEIKNTCLTLTTHVNRINSKNGTSLFLKLLSLNYVSVVAYENQTEFIPKSVLRSIENIQSGALDHIINPEFKFRTDIETVKESMHKLLPTIRYTTGLNEHQSRVLYSICTSTHGNSPYVLMGPPGTGKTQVIAKTIKQLLKMSKEMRILVTAPSNMAADMLAEKIMEQFEDELMGAHNVLRLKSINNEYYERNVKLDPIMKVDHFIKCFEIPKKEGFQKYRVVICTLGCASHIINQDISSGFFTHIFLDEAGQASESDIWIPLGGLANQNTSVILCGDHKQLDPVITLNFSLETTKNFESPLVRLMKMSAYQTDPRLFCQLERSYRCHQAILSIASKLFYNGELLSAIAEREEPFKNWSGLPAKNFPLMFVDVKGRAFREKDGTSFCNRDEIEVVMHYVKKLSKMVKMKDIGVIAPYSYQARLISQNLKKSSILDSNQVTVGSVEKFQGSERKVIIMTGVKTSNLGFIANDLRVNTSITRAKNLLIMIGSRVALSKHESWKLFINYCEQNGALVEWDKNLVNFEQLCLN